MKSLSVKEYLSLKMPTEEAPVSDQSRILLALGALGYEHVTIPLHILRTLYPMCRDANFDITVTLVHRTRLGRDPCGARRPAPSPLWACGGLWLHHDPDAAN